MTRCLKWKMTMSKNGCNETLIIFLHNIFKLSNPLIVYFRGPHKAFAPLFAMRKEGCDLIFRAAKNKDSP